ncbi:hydroxylysine kinase-like [Patiria miniata]|uniref:Hydroxylysine kinase n=1 Tax=Patiria miniata TaxID=46514 RepID=A0A914BKH5_PATMI|nr:hydroxylysine kinase-like [Patiria miniata]
MTPTMTDSEAQIHSPCTLWPKPYVTVDDVQALLVRLYSIYPDVIKECNSYTDRTFYARASPSSFSTFLTSENEGQKTGTHQAEFILKVLNAEFTSDGPGTVAAQVDILNFLKENFPELKCQVPVPTVDGHLLSYEIIRNDYVTEQAMESVYELSAVRMCRYIEGRTLNDAAPLPPSFFYKAGHHLGRLQLALQTYVGDVEPLRRKAVRTIWCLDNVPLVRRHLDLVTDITRRAMLDDVIAAFETTVVPMQGELRKGIVHHDYSDHNVLVVPSSALSMDETTRAANYEISGLIDFDLMVYTCLVNEIAVAMMYLMLCSEEPLRAAAYLLAGFESRAPLPLTERRLLRVLVAGRFAQSLVYGLRSAKLNPGNADYLCSTQEQGWKCLTLLWGHSEQNVMNLLDSISQQNDC